MEKRKLSCLTVAAESNKINQCLVCENPIEVTYRFCSSECFNVYYDSLVLPTIKVIEINRIPKVITWLN